MDYRPQQIEEKWQRRWAEQHVNSLTDDELLTAERPFYNLMMFPYPSAEGLHVGNMYAFTGADIYGRWQRLKGETVFEPIGFDAFGIHSENFALKSRARIRWS
jgi:leucyl-tRNA synthetase